MSDCRPDCTVPGCTKNHGKACPDGSMCDKRPNCSLYHVPRRPKLNQSAAAFTPAKSGPDPTPEASKPQPQSQQTTTSTTNHNKGQTASFGSKHDSNNGLNASATPFKPLPLPPPAQQQHHHHQQHQYEPEYYDETDDFDFYDEDEDDFFDEEEDEEEEFLQLVESIRAHPDHANASEQEVEALANEHFYARRATAHANEEPKAHKPQQQQQQPQPLPQTQVTTTTTTTQSPSNNKKSVCSCCGGSPVLCEGSTVCISRGICICVDDEVDHAKLATWVVSSRLCKCCEGFIYRCKKQTPGCQTECDCKAVAK